MSCRELVELVTEYLEGTLDASDRARFEEHLEECEGCRTYLEQMRTTLRLVREADELEAPPEVTGLMAAFREYRRGQ
jgi:predicted anti-sigma-YlaC factor YlaD